MEDDQRDSPTSEREPHDDVAERDALFDRCRSALKVLPAGSVFSHLTAARLHGLPLSYAMEADDRLHVMRPIIRQRVRRPGIVGHRALHTRATLHVEGLPVVGLADTWADLGELIGPGKPVGLDDTIVLGDAVASRLGTVEPLRQAVIRRVRPRGKCTLVEALDLIRVGSASPGETLSRIPGLLLGIGDHVWQIQRPGMPSDIKLVGEYQGAAFHSSPTQREHDHARQRGLEGDGWLYEEIWNSDMTATGARQATVCRFARRLAIPIESLDLAGCEPRFFSQHAMDQAIQRSDRRRRRSA